MSGQLQGVVVLGDSRNMCELPDKSVHLVVTSPPYYHIKDYAVEGQIGYGHSLHEYFYDLYRVWKECYRVLVPGGRLCVNVGDQFARAVLFGRYKVIPLHSEIIGQGEHIGFDYLGAIVWQKKTTMNTTGGASVMGSFPYPPNGIVEIDYEFILILKKPGKRPPVPREIKERAKLSKEEWKEYFVGHWYFGGARQIEHEAMFPEELPKRLIRMFSFPGDTILDPFLGSGTTMRVALALERNAVGYEINEKFLKVIRKKVSPVAGMMASYREIRRDASVEPVEVSEGYRPMVQDIRPLYDERLFRFNGERIYRVEDVPGPTSIVLDTGLVVRLLGLNVPAEKVSEAFEYLRKFVKGKYVFLRLGSESQVDGLGTPDKNAGKKDIPAYVYLKNRIFVNRKMIEMGIAEPSDESHPLRGRFLRAKEATSGHRVGP